MGRTGLTMRIMERREADDAPPVAGETFVFTQFSGQPQCFLTERELVSSCWPADSSARAKNP